MNVKNILAAKVLGGDIVSIEPTADLAAAAQISQVSKSRPGAPGWLIDIFNKL